MIGILETVSRRWFAPGHPERLAILRILVGAYTLYYVGRRYRMLLKIARTDPVLFKPVGAVAYLKEPVPLNTFRRLLMLTLALNVAFILGWRYRVTGPLFSSLLTWLLCYCNSWSMIFHNDNILVLHALILGLSPSSDALSVDSVWRGPRNQPTDNRRYGWPVQLMKSTTTLTYFVSGVTKCVGPLGMQWARGEHLQSQIAVDGLRKDLLGSGAPMITRRLYRHQSVFRLMGISSLVIELGAPFVLINQRLSQVWAISCLLMHWGIFVVMGIKFRYQLSGLVFASFFASERVLRRLRP